MPKPSSEFGVTQMKQFCQVNRIHSFVRLETSFLGQRRAMIPRAHILTNVTTKQPLPYPAAQIRRYRFAELDRQIADAPPRVEHIGIDKGTRRARVPPDAG